MVTPQGRIALTVMESIRRLACTAWLALLLWLLAAPLALAQAGDWSGVLRPPGAVLRLNLHIEQEPDGRWRGLLISLDQGEINMALDKVVATDETLHLEATRRGVVYDGRWNGRRGVWDGEWRQGGGRLSLTLRPGLIDIPVRAPRPQRPQAPFPYRQEQVTFQSAGARLAGTLTLPQGNGPFPAVILIAGSGPHTRDERVLDHQPFLVLADDLTRRGVAVLRYDKRGTGASLGDYEGATTRDFAADVAAGVAYLRARTDIDPAKVGLVGHSEGGLIAPMIAADDPKIAFLVLLAAPAVPGEAVLVEQSRLIRLSSGQSPAAARIGAQAQQRTYDQIIAGADPKPSRGAEGGPAGLDPGESSLFDNLPWLRFFLTYDPGPALRGLRIPVLAMIGSKDLQVPPGQNLPPLKANLASDSRAVVIEQPGLNHFFQTAGSGSPDEYGRIEETFAPQALQMLGDWIVQQVR